MKPKVPKLPFGLRTLKTVIAVILSMVVVESLGTTDSKLIFAMLGAMAAVMPTFKESVESCLSQIIGVIFGALCGVLLRALPLSSLLAVAIGIILIITLYNALLIRYSPSLACFVLVLCCTTPDIQPLSYALGRIWDTAIGLTIGMGINMLVFPYDNSQQIRATAYGLDQELLRLLEGLFDGDDILPDPGRIHRQIQTLEKQLTLFSNQRLLLHLHRQSSQIEAFRVCEQNARDLISHVEILCSMGNPGRLSEQNRTLLQQSGAIILDQRPLDHPNEQDVVTNYHIARVLALRGQLLAALDR